MPRKWIRQSVTCSLPSDTVTDFSTAQCFPSSPSVTVTRVHVFLTTSWECSALCSQIRKCICLIRLLHGSLFMSGLACMSDRIEAQCCSECAYDPPLHMKEVWEVCLHAWACWSVSCVCMSFKCALECISLPLWICVSKTLMRCQLDSSQLITGCTLGVSVSLTHSHMLFSVLIFRLRCVMLASHSTHSVSLSLCLSLSLHLCVLDVDPLPSLFVNLNFPSWNICLRFSCFSFHLSLHHSCSSHAAAMAKHLGNTVLYKIALKCNAPYKRELWAMKSLPARFSIINSTTTLSSKMCC